MRRGIKEIHVRNKIDAFISNFRETVNYMRTEREIYRDFNFNRSMDENYKSVCTYISVCLVCRESARCFIYTRRYTATRRSGMAR